MTGVVKPKRQKRLTKKRKAEIKAKTKARKRIAKENQKKREAKKLPIYEIPSTILDTYKQEVLATDSVYLSLVRSKCHQQTYEEFSSLEVPTNLANFLTAFKHATEDRNFKLLYELLGKAIKIRDTFLLQQIYEYLYIAIQHDDKIPDRDEVLSEFLARVRLLNNCDPKNYKVTEQTFSYIDDRNSDPEENPEVEKKESIKKETTDSRTSDSSDSSSDEENSSSKEEKAENESTNQKD